MEKQKNWILHMNQEHEMDHMTNWKLIQKPTGEKILVKEIIAHFFYPIKKSVAIYGTHFIFQDLTRE